jgi:NTE family protein
MARRLPLIALMAMIPLLHSACATYGRVENRPYTELDPNTAYTMRQAVRTHHANSLTVVLALSGGGTRAAALAYGVLMGLRDTVVIVNGQSIRLLDEIDVVSAVSGGSFTAAYFGLHGDKLFDDFEEKFLRRDISDQLLDGILNPASWFSPQSRTEMAIDLYDETIFEGATFADLQRRSGPLVIINATDLGRGVRFSFLQEYFDLLCSDLSTFPVARAVAASSAVPVIFNPVVLKNHAGCRPPSQGMFLSTNAEVARSPQLWHLIEGLSSYAAKDQRQYIHLIDGGITDNLGLLSIYEITEAAGGAKKLLTHLGGKPTPYLVVISVNASTLPQYAMETSNRVPSMEDTINSVTDIPIHRTNAATLELIQNSIRRWSSELETPQTPIETFFVKIDFGGLTEPGDKLFFNQIPTSFALRDDQVDRLVLAGRALLQDNLDFQRLIQELSDCP